MKSPYIIIAIIIILIGASSLVSLNTKETVTITVTDKDRISVGTGEDMTHKYIVFTENETFENTDELILTKFNSSDLQGKLRKDSTYTVEVNGYRVPFLNSYRNIIRIIK